jgi:O-antigen ligase
MKGVRRLISALALSGGVVGLIAVIQGGGEAATALTAANRAVGSFTQPNVLGLFLALSIPCQVALALKGPQAFRPVAALCFGLAVAGLALSLSRGAFLGVVGALTLMAAWKPFRRVLLVAAVTFLTLAMVGLNPLQPVLKGGGELVNRITAIRYDDNTQPRVVLYRRTPRLIADHPFFGVGANNFGQHASSYGFVDIAAGVPANHAHNLPLTIAAERGLLGLAALVWLAVALVSNLRQGARARSGLTRAMVVAVAGSLMVLLLEGLVDYGLGTNAIFATVVVLAACTNVFARQAAREARVPRDDEVKPSVRLPAGGRLPGDFQAA